MEGERDPEFPITYGEIPPKTNTLAPPLQLGGITAPPQGTPFTQNPLMALGTPGAPPSVGPPNAPASSPFMPPGVRPSSGAPPMQGGMFPGGPSSSAGTGPSGVAPPQGAGQQFLPPNFQSQLGEAGFFSGPNRTDPLEWVRHLFGGMGR